MEGQPREGRPATLQAKRVYKQLEETTGKGDPGKSHASKGRFEECRNHCSLRNLRLMEEEEWLRAQWAPEYSKQLQNLGSGLEALDLSRASTPRRYAWKCLPPKTFREEDKNPESLEEATDRRSLIFCASAIGDKMIKPSLLYKDPDPTRLTEKD